MAIVPIPNRPQVGRTSPLAPVSAQALAAPGLAALSMLKGGADATASILQTKKASDLRKQNEYVDEQVEMAAFRKERSKQALKEQGEYVDEVVEMAEYRAKRSKAIAEANQKLQEEERKSRGNIARSDWGVRFDAMSDVVNENFANPSYDIDAAKEASIQALETVKEEFEQYLEENAEGMNPDDVVKLVGDFNKAFQNASSSTKLKFYTAFKNKEEHALEKTLERGFDLGDMDMVDAALQDLKARYGVTDDEADTMKFKAASQGVYNTLLPMIEEAERTNSYDMLDVLEERINGMEIGVDIAKHSKTALQSNIKLNRLQIDARVASAKKNLSRQQLDGKLVYVSDLDQYLADGLIEPEEYDLAVERNENILNDKNSAQEGKDAIKRGIPKKILDDIQSSFFDNEKPLTDARGKELLAQANTIPNPYTRSYVVESVLEAMAISGMEDRKRRVFWSDSMTEGLGEREAKFMGRVLDVMSDNVPGLFGPVEDTWQMLEDLRGQIDKADMDDPDALEEIEERYRKKIVGMVIKTNENNHQQLKEPKTKETPTAKPQEKTGEPETINYMEIGDAPEGTPDGEYTLGNGKNVIVKDGVTYERQ